MAERAGKDFSGMWQLGHELPKRPRSAEGAAPQWVGDDKLAGAWATFAACKTLLNKNLIRRFHRHASPGRCRGI